MRTAKQRPATRISTHNTCVKRLRLRRNLTRNDPSTLRSAIAEDRDNMKPGTRFMTRTASIGMAGSNVNVRSSWELSNGNRACPRSAAGNFTDAAFAYNRVPSRTSDIALQALTPDYATCSIIRQLRLEGLHGE